MFKTPRRKPWGQSLPSKHRITYTARQFSPFATSLFPRIKLKPHPTTITTKPHSQCGQTHLHAVTYSKGLLEVALHTQLACDLLKAKSTDLILGLCIRSIQKQLDRSRKQDRLDADCEYIVPKHDQGKCFAHKLVKSTFRESTHLQGQATRNQDEMRCAANVRLVKSLLDRGMSVDQVRHLFRFIDWLMILPIELEERFDVEIYEYQKEKKMKYISVLERKAMEKGREEGIEKGIEKGRRETLLKLIASGLTANHPDSVDEIMALVERTVDVNTLQHVPQMIWTGESLDKIRAVLLAE